MIYTSKQLAEQAMNGTHDVAYLSPVQQAMYHAYESVVKQFGQFDKTAGAQGSHYAPAAANPFQAEGLICANCVYYSAGACEIVAGSIEPNAICKLWIIPEDKLN